MTGTVTSSGRGGTAAAVAQNEQTTEKHSMQIQAELRVSVLHHKSRANLRQSLLVNQEDIQLRMYFYLHSSQDS